MKEKKLADTNPQNFAQLQMQTQRKNEKKKRANTNPPLWISGR
jgi:hypothetical protein